MKTLPAYVPLALAICIAFAAAASVSAQTSDRTRPADLALWPTLGTTMRMSAEDGSKPGQMRHIQMSPQAYAQFAVMGAYPDGAEFTASMYAVTLDETHDPHLYYASQEVALALEVIDCAHPDGRRFYVFTPGGQTAQALTDVFSFAALQTTANRSRWFVGHPLPTADAHL